MTNLSVVRAIIRSLAAALYLAAGARLAARAADNHFSVQFTATVHPAPYTGRVYIFFGSGGGEPRHGPNWFHPGDFIARDVVNCKPGESIEFSEADPGILAYPRPMKEMHLAGAAAQAVVRFNAFERKIGNGAGNGYSAVVAVNESAGSTATHTLLVDRIVPPPKFVETPYCKEFHVRSELLSRFYGRDFNLSAAVLLPAGYAAQADRRFPTIFEVPGFGGTHYVRREAPEPDAPNGVEFVRVVLDPSCPLGHHVFADSANNGPVGEALVAEFLPAFHRAYRTLADGRARFLTGHSSGGWSTLWLQITYPGRFGGTWSTSPDPVDFRDFQMIDLYRRGEDFYVDHSGHDRPLARFGRQVLVTMRSFTAMEDVLGPGGQMHSFEAVFSPRGPDGRPRRLWNRQSGAIDVDVAKTWEKYDIRLVLERNWKTLGPKLAGKLHVFMGDLDTFYLDGATRLLKESLAKLGSDAVVEMHPGKDHMTLLDGKLRRRIRQEMAEAFLKSFPAQAEIGNR